jgi:hypothetical protein
LKGHILDLWHLKLVLPFRFIYRCSGFYTMLKSTKWALNSWRNKLHILPPKRWYPPTGLQCGFIKQYAMLWHFMCCETKM